MGVRLVILWCKINFLLTVNRKILFLFFSVDIKMSSADAAQRSILYFVELLMNSNRPLTIAQLAGHFGDRSFTPEMRTAAGGNEMGLRKFMEKYPSLFTIRGNQVSIYGCLDDDIGPSDVCEEADGVPDVTAEMSAVGYFRSKLMPKGNRWIEIKSLAGHLSQATPEVRKLVGPQVEFVKWLLRHQHIFEVRDSKVRLQKDVLADSLMTFASHDDSDTDSVCSSRSFSGDSDVERKRIESSRTTKQEQKLVWLVKDLVKAKGSIDLNTITSLLVSHAPIELLGIGERIDPIRTIRKYPGIFRITENNAVMLASKSAKGGRSRRQTADDAKVGPDDRIALMACSGPVFHLSKLWGIIDLGQHEHVFFDQSIIEKSSDVIDLKEEYEIGELLYFDAVRAPRSSRAKWKAVRVWKAVEECEATVENKKPAGRPKKLKRKTEESSNCESFLQPVDDTAEQLMLRHNWRNADDLVLSPVDDDLRPPPLPAVQPKQSLVDAECQTISTGDIIATQFFFSE